MTKNPESSASTRMFGALVRALREDRNLTIEDVAEHAGYSKSMVIKVERGERMPPPTFIERASALLQAGNALYKAADHLERSKHPEFFEEYAELEAKAVSLHKYDNYVINGLLQTEAYARALLSDKALMLEQAEIAHRVKVRLDRQLLLGRSPMAQMSFLIDESALTRPLGGPEVYKEQLLRLLEIGELPNVGLQVVPTTDESHPGFNGPMTLLETQERRFLAYLEVQGHSFLIGGRETVSDLQQQYAMIRTHALSARESAKMIEKIAGAL